MSDATLVPLTRPPAGAPSSGTESTRNTALIEVRKLSLHYGNVRALQDVSFDIRERVVTALIGPSGCGKSTFLRSLNRMHELIPEARMEGEIRLFGADIYGTGIEPVVVRRRVGMVFQKSNPFHLVPQRRHH